MGKIQGRLRWSHRGEVSVIYQPHLSCRIGGRFICSMLYTFARTLSKKRKKQSKEEKQAIDLFPGRVADRREIHIIVRKLLR